MLTWNAIIEISNLLNIDFETSKIISFQYKLQFSNYQVKNRNMLRNNKF
jgi:hypothetical protein